MDEQHRRYHEVANLFPLMQGEEYEALKSDIAENGQREPIWLHQDGSIIDGRNRHRACVDLGITPHFETWNGNGSLVSFVVSLNLYRRHLTPSQATAVAVEVLPMLEEEARERQRQAAVRTNAALGRSTPKTLRANSPEASLEKPEPKQDSTERERPREVAASMLGIGSNSVQRGKAIKQAAPDLFDKMRSGEMSTNQAHKEMKRREREQERQSDIVYIDSDVWHGDMRDLGHKLADNSVDLILTDPPYPGEYLPLFSDLSAFAARTLKPGGLCLVYSGQIFLPQVMQRLGESLEYLWTFAIRHSGGNQRIFKVNVNTSWKPVIAYCKPPISLWWDSFIDLVSGGREKDLHEWQQAESEAAYFIEHLSLPNQLVVDPFCGSGTVLSAAKKLGRQYVGMEVNAEHVANASRRLQ